MSEGAAQGLRYGLSASGDGCGRERWSAGGRRNVWGCVGGGKGVGELWGRVSECGEGERGE